MFSGCQEARNAKLFRLMDASRSGVTSSNKLESTPALNIFNYLYFYNGAGVAIADFDNDGLDDIYLVCNQCADALYLNKGQLSFENVTKLAGIKNDQGWSFGVSVVDINADGWLDIYLTKVGDYKGIKGKNLLFVNEGVNSENIPVFSEQASKYGLDISSFGTQTAFFDYDLDGDLDAFLLNHSVHPNRTYGLGQERRQFDELSGDRLLENRDAYFEDVSAAVGIFQGKIGYGLDVSLGDVNNDGYPDIYVGNDFFENDYLYLSNGDKTFTEVVSGDSNPLGHTTHFSMGNAIDDVNNDGLLDIISLDMLPESLVSFKTSGSEYSFPVYRQYLKNGYSPQFMQNTLHLNNGASFSEVAFQQGVASTEWSWGVLSADFDLDGRKDLIITNGIPGATNDMDYVSFASQQAFQELIEAESVENIKNLDKIPSKYVANYAYRNAPNGFVDVSSEWLGERQSFSNGAAYGDLDNDGDLDLVVNNINERAFIYENLLEKDALNFLKVKLKGAIGNINGVGARVEVYTAEKSLFKENYPNHTYLSSVSPVLHFGLGKSQIADSVIVIWPGGARQTVGNVASNVTLKLDQNDAVFSVRNKEKNQQVLKPTTTNLDFSHQENSTLDFDRSTLIPNAKSNEGPTMAVADIDADGIDDLLVGGAKGQGSKIFLSSAGFSTEHNLSLGLLDPIKEATASHFFDADGDGDLDLVIGFGGNEFISGEALRPGLLINETNEWKKRRDLQELEIHVSKVESFDFDRDGDLDLLVTSNTVTGEFGKSSTNHLLLNESGAFVDGTIAKAPAFYSYGLIEDFQVLDVDSNGYEDVVVAGNWTPITIFYNDGQALNPSTISGSYGLWNSIQVDDFDQDGDVDIVAGNFGLNSRLVATEEQPMRLYRYDFDQNGKVDPILTYYYKDEETVFNSKDELMMQLPFLKKRYLSYRTFAEASVSEIFGENNLERADKKEVHMLQSSYFENQENTKFVSRSLPPEVQVSTIQDIFLEDFNGDGYMDLLVNGNTFELSTQIGRMDGLHGVLLINDQKGFFEVGDNLNILGAVREVETMKIENENIYIIGRNNAAPIFLKKNTE